MHLKVNYLLFQQIQTIFQAYLTQWLLSISKENKIERSLLLSLLVELKLLAINKLENS